MKQHVLCLFVCFALLLGTVIGQDCIASGEGTGSGAVDITTLPPDHVLYVIIGTGYYDSMILGYNYLRDYWINDASICTTGCTVELANLRSNIAIPNDLSGYSQIWVVDLNSAADQDALMMDGYGRISQWWRDKGRPHLILDGRILSSIWVSGHAQRPNPSIIRNYYANLRIRGGGLFLGTDHWPSFTSGINEINKNIGVGEFYGFFYESPFKMEVDIQSPLMNYPAACYCTSGSYNYIWDDSSTANVPTNVQTNNLILYPLGWHSSQGFGEPGLSSTIRGQIGFLVTMTSPTCQATYYSTQTVSFSATIDSSFPGQAPYSYTWTSDVDGTLATVASGNSVATFSRTLTIGVHNIALRIRDYAGLTAQAKAKITVVFNNTNPDGPVVIWNNLEVRELNPIRRPTPAASYYNYGGNAAYPTSAATPDSLEGQIPQSGQFFFYDDGSNNLYIDHLFGSPTDQSAANSVAAIKFPAIKGVAGTIVARDDPTSTTFNWNSAAGTGSATWTWQGQTQGFVAGPLPYTMDYCVIYNFTKNSEVAVENYAVRTHAKPSFALPNPEPIISYKWKGISTNSLQLCYRQLRCSTTPQVFTGSFGRVTNQIVQFGYNVSTQWRYTDTPCNWIVQPTLTDAPAAIGFYFSEYAQAAGDTVSAYNGPSTSTLVSTFPAGTSVPADFAVSNPTSGAVYWAHTPTNNGNTNTGFYVFYSVVPTSMSVDKDGLVQAPVLVTVTGRNFYNNATNTLKCRFTFTNSSTADVVATYVNNNTITCSAPAGPTGIGSLAVSNEGRFFSTALAFEWLNGACGSFLTCGVCLGQSGCDWCNDGTGVCFAHGNGTCADLNVGMPTSSTPCCSACQNNNGCSGHGACQCNNTCACDSTHQGEDCGCVVCPSQVTGGPQCGGVVGDEVQGTCNCNGTCTCAFGLTGDACQCKTCDGYPEPCNGNGVCGCDGTCSCNAGWISTTVPAVCECSTVCPNNCSGHGNCSCGTCICDAGFGILEDCSCQESCPFNCNGQGSCNCDGTCSCAPGYSGEFCDTFNLCNASDCDNCTALGPDCAWCVENFVCENIYLSPELSNCYITNTTTGDKKPGNLTQACPSAVVPGNIPPPNRTGIAVAAAVGGAAVAAAAAGLAAYLYRKKAKGFLSTGESPFDGDSDGVVSNPLYEVNGTSGSNPLYQQ